MSERDLEARLEAVERALTDDDTDLTDLRETADAVGEASDLEARVAALESRVDELEAGLQAVRGYAGNVRAVNREVERRASAALAKAEALESTVEDGGSPVEPTVAPPGAGGRARERPAAPAPNGERPAGSPGNAGDSVDSPASARRSPADSTDLDGVNAGSGGDVGHSGAGGDRDGDGQIPPGSAPAPRDEGAPHSGRQARGGGRSRPQRSRSGADDAGSDEPGPAEAESQTEQFIERVRDAL
ncbi:hypothetical protein [Halosimplex sp. TS25]|uniref:DUF7310 family coiled-coil domain-containing protein n=1 Tax=Halosimplex rarum TaxID=3396619 RepID=UPI0039E769F8